MMDAFRFAEPEYLYLLITIPIFFLYLIYSNKKRKKSIKKFGNPKLIQQLMPNASPIRYTVKALLLISALFCLIIALAQPQFGTKISKDKRKGIELVIALDVSNSMLAQDIKPNRLERSKMAISQLTKRMGSDKMSLIIFGGESYTQIPMTSDYSAAKMFLSQIDTKSVPIQGTAIGSAIELGINSFSPNYKGSKAIIVITDGENHEDDAVGMAQAAKEKGIIVHTIGMGSEQGAPIPVGNGSSVSYRKDKEGKTIITRLDEKMLQEIAEAGGGKFVRANNSQVGLNYIFNDIEKMEKSEMETVSYSQYADRYMYFVYLALFLILLEFVTIERKNRWFKKVYLFESKTEKK